MNRRLGTKDDKPWSSKTSKGDKRRSNPAPCPSLKDTLNKRPLPPPSHPSLSPSAKEGRGRTQGNALACGPPAGKKIKFDVSFGGGASAGGEEQGEDDGESEGPSGQGVGPGEGERTRSIVGQGLLSQRKSARAEAAPSSPTGQRRREDAALKPSPVLRPEQDETGPLESEKSKPLKDTADKASMSSGTSARIQSIAAILSSATATSLAPFASPSAQSPPYARHEPFSSKAFKTTRLTDPQRDRAKAIRHRWIQAEGLSAKEANSRWVDILSAAGWNGEVALLVAKHFGAARWEASGRGDGVGEDKRDKPTSLQSYRHSPVIETPDAVDEPQRSPPPDVSETVASTGVFPPTPALTPAQRRCETSPRPPSAFFNPFTSSVGFPPSSSSAFSVGPSRPPVLPPPAPSPFLVSASSSAPPISETPSDRALSTSAIRVLQTLPGLNADSNGSGGPVLSIEATLDLVDLFTEDVRAAEVFLALEGDALKVLWVRRRVARMGL